MYICNYDVILFIVVYSLCAVDIYDEAEVKETGMNMQIHNNICCRLTDIIYISLSRLLHHQTTCKKDHLQFVSQD